MKFQLNTLIQWFDNDIAKNNAIKSYAVLAYDGGRCIDLADIPIHFKNLWLKLVMGLLWTHKR